MKKIVVILLICVYALATMGFSLKRFYCCGNLKTISLSLTGNDDNTCSKSHSNKDHCCKNKFQYFKVKNTQIIASHINLPVNSFVFITLDHLSFKTIIFAPQKSIISYRSNAPPLYDNVPVYISNHVFRV